MQKHVLSVISWESAADNAQLADGDQKWWNTFFFFVNNIFDKISSDMLFKPQKLYIEFFSRDLKIVSEHKLLILNKIALYYLSYSVYNVHGYTSLRECPLYRRKGEGRCSLWSCSSGEHPLRWLQLPLAAAVVGAAATLKDISTVSDERKKTRDIKKCILLTNLK